MKLSGSGLLFFWSYFLITDWISICIINLVKLFILDSVLAYCMFLEICPFLLGCPICWHITICNILLWFFVSVVLFISPLSFLILFIWVLSLFSLTSGLSILSFQKKPSSWFHWSFLGFFWPLLYLFPLWSLLFPFFCWLWALFVLILILLSGRLNCLFEIFLVSWGKPVLHKLPS